MGAISFKTITRTVALSDQARLRLYPPAYGLERWQVDGIVDDGAAKMLVMQLIGTRQSVGSLDHVVLDWQDATVDGDGAAMACDLAEKCGARLSHKPAGLGTPEPDSTMPQA